MIFLTVQPIVPVLIIVAIGAIAFSVYYFNNKQVILRKLSKTRHKSIASLKTGEFVKVHGKALHVQVPLIAPLTKGKCIFYKIEIEKKVSTGKSSHWKTIVNEEKVQDFFIEHNGSYVIVKPTKNPRNFKSHLVIDTKTSSGTFSDPSPAFEALLKHYGINSEGFFGFNKQLRYREGVIEIGEKITVAGIAKWKTLSEPIPEYSYSKIVALESSDKEKIIITDHPEAFERTKRGV